MTFSCMACSDIIHHEFFRRSEFTMKVFSMNLCLGMGMSSGKFLRGVTGKFLPIMDPTRYAIYAPAFLNYLLTCVSVLTSNSYQTLLIHVKDLDLFTFSLIIPLDV